MKNNAKEQLVTTIAKATDENTTLTVETPGDVSVMALQAGEAAMTKSCLPNPHRPKDLTRRTKQHCIDSRMHTRSTRRGGTAVLEAKERNQERIEIEECWNGNNEQEQQMRRIGRDCRQRWTQTGGQVT
ncbi:hypothetical protein BLNAU_11978 [Blattamonas nauphoetae]|uniref:Uncharacterized protein n=1 Tax=Blattamonas nauphoetae TaxID=2049346 RepID=A0ABQ9XQA7_9EUKA|nr:hypothetical protein BLNAU_11978 [Blattamonas nauphoetae]